MRFIPPRFWGTEHYEALEKNDSVEDDNEEKEPLRKSRSHIVMAVMIVVLVVAAAFLGHAAGRKTCTVEKDDWLAPAGTINHTFKYRRSFAEEPTGETEHLWEIMFPKGRGFIQHPSISSQVMGVAVFHQVHCLDSLRRGYYAAMNGSKPNDLVDTAHMRHCIDYLRQSLMCAADTNMEPLDTKLGGVTGWGPRKCRDIVAIKEWTEKWRTHNQTMII